MDDDRDFQGLVPGHVYTLIQVTALLELLLLSVPSDWALSTTLLACLFTRGSFTKALRLYGRHEGSPFGGQPVRSRMHCYLVFASQFELFAMFLHCK